MNKLRGHTDVRMLEIIVLDLLCPLQLLSCALEIGLSVMELQGLNFFKIMHTSALMFLKYWH